MKKLITNLRVIFDKGRYAYTSVLLFLIALVIRLYFININHAEFTLGIIFMNYSQNLGAKTEFDIFYPMMIRLFNLLIPSIEVAAKFVSIIFGSLTVSILFLITQQLLKNFRVSCIVGLLLATQPIHMYWSIHVVADSLFIFLFLLAIYLFLMDKIKWSAIILALSTLTKFECSILFLVLFFHLFVNKKYNKDIIFSLCYIPIVVIWVLIKSGSSADRVIFGIEHFSLIHSVHNAYFYCISFPYVYTLPISIFIMFGIFLYVKKYLISDTPNSKNFDNILHVLRDVKFLPIVIVISYYMMNFAWHWVQFRHSLPMIAFLLIFGAYGIEKCFDFIRSKWMLTIGNRHLSRLIILLFTIFLLVLLAFHSFDVGKERINDMHEYFGDIKDASVWISENTPYNATIYSNEPKKAKFYSKRNVHGISNTTHIKIDGDAIYFIISDYYTSCTPLNEKSLIKEYGLIPIKTFKAKIKYSYPCAGTNIVSQTYKWFSHRNDMVHQETIIYIMPPKN